jgi:hypothetical protein
MFEATISQVAEEHPLDSIQMVNISLDSTEETGASQNTTTTEN